MYSRFISYIVPDRCTCSCCLYMYMLVCSLVTGIKLTQAAQQSDTIRGRAAGAAEALAAEYLPNQSIREEGVGGPDRTAEWMQGECRPTQPFYMPTIAMLNGRQNFLWASNHKKYLFNMKITRMKQELKSIRRKLCNWFYIFNSFSTSLTLSLFWIWLKIFAFRLHRPLLLFQNSPIFAHFHSNMTKNSSNSRI